MKPKHLARLADDRRLMEAHEGTALNGPEALGLVRRPARPRPASWQTAISRTDAPAIGVWSPRLRRVAWLSRTEFAVMAWSGKGRTAALRTIAAALGCSLGGVTHAIARLVQLGLLAVATARGRHGWTRLWRKAGVSVANVPTKGTTISRTYSPPEMSIPRDVLLGGTFPARMVSAGLLLAAMYGRGTPGMG